MFTIPTRDDRIGSGDFVVVVRIPQEHVRWGERCRLRRAGLVDRIRNRGVADDLRTYYLHLVERQVRRMEGEVTKRMDEGISRIDARLAELVAIIAASSTAPAPSGPVSAPASRGTLSGLAGRDRAEWAAAGRASRRAAGGAGAVAAAASAREAARAARLEDAQIEHARLSAERPALVAEGEAARRLWREAFAVRAAFYNRVRFGFFGATPVADPAIPDYGFAVGPTLDRSLAGKAPGAIV